MAIAELEGQSRGSSEVIFRGRTTFRTLLEMGQDKDRAGLADIPFKFRAFDRGDHFLFVASFPNEASLTRQSLIRVLRAAKPGNYSRWEDEGDKSVLDILRVQSFEEIIGDWDIIIFEQQQRNKLKKKLHDAHFAVDPDFVEFERNHFSSFWRAINSSDPDDGIVPLIIWKRDKKTGEASYHCGKIEEESHDALLGQIVVACYSTKVRKSLPTKLPLPITSHLLVELQNNNPELFEYIITRLLGRRQEIRGGQIPAFVLKYAKRFLNEGLAIARLEELSGVPKIRPRWLYSSRDSFPFSNGRR